MTALRRALAMMAITAGTATAAQAQGGTAPPRDTAVRTTVSGDLGYVSFNNQIEAWRTASVSVAHRNAHGSIIGRVNVASRFGTNGAQVEVDAYPRFGGGRYLYLNAGISGSSIFPDQRVGAEWFTNLPDAWEASIGLRALWFDGMPVTLYTGTIGKYSGNYWLSLRPFVHVKPTGGTTASAGLTVRRYTANADNYFGGRVGIGSSPSDNVTPDAIARTSWSSFSLQGSRTFGRSYVGTWSAGHDSEGLDGERSRSSWTVTVGLAYRY